MYIDLRMVIIIQIILLYYYYTIVIFLPLYLKTRHDEPSSTEVEAGSAH